MRVGELLSRLGGLAPEALAEEWDNVGLLVGRPDSEVASVLIALDLRDAVLAQAKDEGHGAILTHHPLIFPELYSVSPATTPGDLALAAAEAGIAIVAAHTNLDSARGGLNDLMAGALGLGDTSPLTPHATDPDAGLGRVGDLPASEPLGDLAARADRLWPSGSRLAGDPDRAVRRIAVCTGAGGGLIDAARSSGAEAFITCDLRYHDADRADGMALIGLDHAAVEAALLAGWAPALAAALGPEVCAVRVADGTTSPWSDASAR